MSCIFCDSFNHVSGKCDIHISNISRQNAARTKKICHHCFEKWCVSKASKFTVYICRSFKKCYICYSKDHHTALCLDRFTAANLFIPNIDPDLYPRFLAILESLEKFTLAFQSPTILALCKLCPIRIFDNLYLHRFNINSEKNISICKKYTVSYYHCIQKSSIFENMITKKWEVCAEKVKISRSEISPYHLYAMLSPRTKVLKIKWVTFLPNNITMDEILTKAPNFKELKIHFAVVRIDENFFKYGYGKNLKMLKFTVNHDFDAAYLIPFLEKNKLNIEIILCVNAHFPQRHDRDLFLKKFEDLFVPAKQNDRPSLTVCLEKRKNYDGVTSYDFVKSFIYKKPCSL